MEYKLITSFFLLVEIFIKTDNTTIIINCTSSFLVFFCVCVLDSSYCVALSVQRLSMYTVYVQTGLRLKEVHLPPLATIGTKGTWQISVRNFFSSTVNTNLNLCKQL